MSHPRARDPVAAGAAHDIRTHLSYLTANLEHLERSLASGVAPTDQEDLRACVVEALVGARRIRGLAEDLLPGVGHGEEPPVDLGEVLLSCVKAARVRVQHDARVDTDIGAIPCVAGGEARLYRLFLNLIVNAAEAVLGTTTGEPRIRIVARPDGPGKVLVEVSDSGPGIREDLLERIFDPFFTTRSGPGHHGLGLANCQRIVAEVGGTIEVTNPRGGGALFRVTLPVREAEPSGFRSIFLTPCPPAVRRLDETDPPPSSGPGQTERFHERVHVRPGQVEASRNL